VKPEAESRRPEVEGLATGREPLPASGFALPASGETCDYCGAESVVWRKCKLICGACGNIIKSCADL
jgi:hypothetical protein